MKKLTLILLMFPALARATTYTAATCGASDFQTQINLSVNGDTVQGPLAGGSATWNTIVTVGTTHQITLNGNACSVTFGSAGGLTVTAGSTINTRVTNFTFTGAFTNGNYPIELDTGTQTMRFDHNTLGCGTPGAPSTFIGVNNNGPALIDHNSFSCANGADEMIHVLGVGGNTGWTDVVTPGGTSMIFIEDNTFSDSGTGGNSAIQSYYGARTVFRHNTLTNMQIDQHGTAGMVGARWWEVYNNNFQNQQQICIRAGSGVIFSNTNLPGIIMVEEDSGYPALYQVGQGQMTGGNATPCDTGGPPGCTPAYVWLNGSATLSLNVTGCAPPAANMVQLNRDVYQASTGLLSALPSTCSTFQAYFATDTNTLYKCTATNTWTSYYTPYTYPHPLQGGGSQSWRTNRQGAMKVSGSATIQ